MAPTLALIVLSVALAGPAEAQVDRLGSPRYADREEAVAELERMGREALPALRGALDSKDLEVRNRATALVDRIEASLLTMPTLIAMDFQDAPIAEVVRSIRDRSGVNLNLRPEESPAWKDRKVTAVEAEPVPFWPAIDRLCEAGRVRINPGFPMVPGRGERSLTLIDGESRDPSPRFDTGPFRVRVVELDHQRKITYLPTQPGAVVAPGGPSPTLVNEQFYLTILVMGEPRLSLQQESMVKVVEAVDDLGQSLVLPTNGPTPASGQRVRMMFSGDGNADVRVLIPLRRPESPGKAIRSIRGLIPLAVSSRKSDPFTIELADPVDKPARTPDAIITVREIKPGGDGPTTFHLAIAPRDGVDPNDPAMPAFRNHATIQQRIEVVDARGSTLAWFPSNMQTEGANVRITMHVPPQANQGAPARLLYYAMVRAQAEVPFEFRDLPMP